MSYDYASYYKQMTEYFGRVAESGGHLHPPHPTFTPPMAMSRPFDDQVALAMYMREEWVRQVGGAPPQPSFPLKRERPDEWDDDDAEGDSSPLVSGYITERELAEGNAKHKQVRRDPDLPIPFLVLLYNRG